MKRSALYISLAVVVGGLLLTLAAGPARATGEEAVVEKPETILEAYQELFEMSIRDGKGLTFFVGGQSIPGVVTRLIGDEGVEVRNREHSRVVIRLDRIDAVAAN